MRRGQCRRKRDSEAVDTVLAACVQPRTWLEPDVKFTTLERNFLASSIVARSFSARFSNRNQIAD
jgi:hypothetical protein